MLAYRAVNQEGTAIVAGDGGFGINKELIRIPFEMAGSPTAIRNPMNDFYSINGSNLKIRKGFCGDYHIYGVSTVLNRKFDVLIESKLNGLTRMKFS